MNFLDDFYNFLQFFKICKKFNVELNVLMFVINMKMFNGSYHELEEAQKNVKNQFYRLKLFGFF